MTITVKAGSLQKKYMSGSPAVLDLPDGTTALEAALAAGLPESEIGTITINSRSVDFDTVLSGNDIISVYPLIIGG